MSLYDLKQDAALEYPSLDPNPRAMGHYRGWRYNYSDARPVTGRWRAMRHGVGMCAGTEEQLRRMIDNHNQE